MPFGIIIAALSGALGWAWVTRETKPEGERETVIERLLSNLGGAAIAGAATVAAVWVWRRRGG